MKEAVRSFHPNLAHKWKTKITPPSRCFVVPTMEPTRLWFLKHRLPWISLRVVCSRTIRRATSVVGNGIRTEIRSVSISIFCEGARKRPSLDRWSDGLPNGMFTSPLRATHAHHDVPSTRLDSALSLSPPPVRTNTDRRPRLRLFPGYAEPSDRNVPRKIHTLTRANGHKWSSFGRALQIRGRRSWGREALSDEGSRLMRPVSSRRTASSVSRRPLVWSLP